ncbi:MAG: hypothetical protein JJU18_09365 [Oceanicaulis sp.]|nr:hypothetical protein [Oceanicaulis sp.]
MSGSKVFRIALAGFAAAAVVCAWAGVGAAYFLDVPRSVFVIAVFVAAFATEGAFWVILFLLGWSAVANRHWLVRMFKGAGKPGEGDQAETRG